MTWQEELAAHALVAARQEPAIAEVVVAGSLADGGADPFDPVRWVAQFGRPWALTSTGARDGRVLRVVYDDGRRLDVVLTGGGTGSGAVEGTELMEFRQAAALAVVKLARNDLLIGMHLALGLVHPDEQAMVLRDRQLGTTSHRVGGPFNEVVERQAGC